MIIKMQTTQLSLVAVLESCAFFYVAIYLEDGTFAKSCVLLGTGFGADCAKTEKLEKAHS
jgi:hypothetical protein